MRKGTTKIIAILIALLMTAAVAGCAAPAAPAAAPAPASAAPAAEPAAPAAAPAETAAEAAPAIAKKACLITSSPRGGDFIELVWDGLEQLEAEGWEVKCIETVEAAEYPDQIRAMAEAGYNVMYTIFDEVSTVALDLADELAENYPDLHVFMLDTYMEHDKPNCTSVSVDPFESSFVAGYVAANMTEKDTVCWIGHKDILKIQRFRDGYIAGVNYADKGKEVVYAFTGDPFDPVKGYETAIQMIENNDIDIIYQSNYLGGPGVIKACAEKGIKCIGVDDWQGGIDKCVFWSAIKAMNVATYSLAKGYAEGVEYGANIDFNISSGGAVYDERDEKNIPPELLANVKQLIEDIKSGKVDVYEGFDQYRLSY